MSPPEVRPVRVVYVEPAHLASVFEFRTGVVQVEGVVLGDVLELVDPTDRAGLRAVVYVVGVVCAEVSVELSVSIRRSQ